MTLSATHEPRALLKSQAEHAYSMLVEQIIRLDLAPGQILLDRELTAVLGIGRTPVREALQRLAREGLVVHFPHRGMVVAEISATGTRDIYEFRSLIDGEAARLAAERATQKEITELKRIAEELSVHAESAEVDTYVHLDRTFYEILSTASRNHYIAETIPRILNLHLRLWFYIVKMKDDWRTLALSHSAMTKKVAEAIAIRDASGAQSAVRDYVAQRQKDMQVLM
jgi:DNA-binding GntR family transcriptional regulator